MKYILILLGTLMLMGGCANSYSTKGGTGGGNIEIKHEVVQVEDAVSGTVTTTTTDTVTADASLVQPNSPGETGTLHLKSGESEINISTGKAWDISKTLAAVGLLRYVTFAGIFIVIAAGVIFYFTKSLKGCLILGGTGVFLIVASYLLAQYSAIFMFIIGSALVLFLGYCVYLLYHYQLRDKATEENVDLIDYIKNEILTPEQEKMVFDRTNGIVNSIQSNTTRKLVNEFKTKLANG